MIIASGVEISVAQTSIKVNKKVVNELRMQIDIRRNA